MGSTPGHCVDYNDIAVQRFISAKTRVSAEKTMLLLQLLADLDAIDKKLWGTRKIWSQNFVDNIYTLGGFRRTETPKKPDSGSNNTSNSELLPNKPEETVPQGGLLPNKPELTPQRKEKGKEKKVNKNTTVGGEVSPHIEKKVSKSKQKAESEPYWKELVSIYFSFCYEKFNEKPSFDDSAPHDMHRIIEALKKRAEEKSIEWTEDVAKLRWRGFLGIAYQDDWLSKNWLLSNLNRQKDKIFLNIVNPKNGKPVTNSVGKTFVPD